MKLLGTVTDGDIRAIIKKIDFKSHVNNIMNKTPVVINEKLNINFAKE